VKLENVLPARSATSLQEFIATFTDSCWDVIGFTSLGVIASDSGIIAIIHLAD
jgi:hypothetical protein